MYRFLKLGGCLLIAFNDCLLNGVQKPEGLISGLFWAYNRYFMALCKNADQKKLMRPCFKFLVGATVFASMLGFVQFFVGNFNHLLVIRVLLKLR